MRKIDPTTSANPPSHSIVVSIQPGHCTKWLNVHSTRDDEKGEKPDGEANAFPEHRAERRGEQLPEGLTCGGEHDVVLKTLAPRI